MAIRYQVGFLVVYIRAKQIFSPTYQSKSNYTIISGGTIKRKEVYVYLHFPSSEKPLQVLHNAHMLSIEGALQVFNEKPKRSQFATALLHSTLVFILYFINLSQNCINVKNFMGSPVTIIVVIIDNLDMTKIKN